MVKKIVIIGPESTGKSTLSEQLATHYNTVWCPEFARDYLLEHGTKYNYDDLLSIAKGQIELEEKFELLARNPGSAVTGKDHESDGGAHNANLTTPSPLTTHHSLLFIDTNMYVMKVWCEFVFGKCHQYILDQIDKRKYDLYLLCNIDLPWTYDELREYPDLERRQTLYEMYKNLMKNQPVPWKEISGNSEQRFRMAVSAVDNS
jgi:nicotinamide riboside kinase